ncbi:PITH domain-containing protein CG6153 [Halyomorpha halys]|uniref:PITH domain-containing protein CG6153 n=1 Tax=Halyomorpha halys TaxID=286706 RepID=UPI0034D371FD
MLVFTEVIERFYDFLNYDQPDPFVCTTTVIMNSYKNRPYMTFDDTSISPDQEFDLHPDNAGTLEYSTMVVKFSSVHHLSIHFPSNFGSDSTKLYYIGLRGEFSPAHRHGVTICTYETQPNVSDLKKTIGSPVEQVQ